MKNQNFSGVLSREEMRLINGGMAPGTCGVYYTSASGATVTGCASSKDSVVAIATATNGYWCCDSCATTSWYQLGCSSF